MSKVHMEEVINSTLRTCAQDDCSGALVVRELVEYLPDSGEIMLSWRVTSEVEEEIDLVQMALWNKLSAIPLEPGKNAVYLEKDDYGLLEAVYTWKATKEDYAEYKEGMRRMYKL